MEQHGSRYTKRKRILLIIETSRAFGRGLLRGISHHVLEHDDWIVHVEDRGLFETTQTWLKNWKGDGIIVRSSSHAMVKLVRSANVPYVELLGNGLGVVSEVRNDEDAVARSAADCFQRSGVENFGFFAIGNAWWSNLRRQAFEENIQKRKGNFFCFQQAGAGPRVFYPVWETRFDRQMQNWLKKIPKPIAIWAVSDALAIRLLEGCRRENIAVPEQVAILGTTNDSILCNALRPSLSSIDLNSFQIGYVAAGRLRTKLAGELPESAPVLIPPIGVVQRQSTDVIAFSDPELTEAVRILREQASSGITVEQIVEHVGLSRSTLQRRFHKTFGHSIEKELIRTKMERAKRLLCETGFALSAIAIKSGFATTEYFVQAFRREIGITPHQYRKKTKTIPDNPEGPNDY